MTHGQAKTLSGMQVLVTRAAHQSGGFAERMRVRGAIVYEIPTLTISTPETWEALDSAIRGIYKYRWVIFSSANGVYSFFDRAQELGCILLPETISIATVGPATARSVERYGHHSQYHPDEFIADAFVKQFPGYPNFAGTSMLWAKGDTGRWLIRDKLTQAGVTVDWVVCYRSTMPDDSGAVSRKLAALLQQERFDAITVASGQTAKNLYTLAAMSLNENQLQQVLTSVPVVTIGPETSAAAGECGFKQIYQANAYTTEGMIAVLEGMAARKRLHSGHYRPDQFF